jgi:hypothetical protein
MTMTLAPIRPIDNGANANTAEVVAHGGRFATILSALALVFSGLSYYESVLKTADLEVFVPPVIHYGRDQGGDVEVFAIPVTISNEGARTGTVLSMELEVENLKSDAEPKRKRYYGAYLGEHPRDAASANRAFAPLSIAGRATFTETVRFYPVGYALPKLASEGGDYRFTLKLNTAAAKEPDIIDRAWRKEPTPLSFDLQLPWISEQHLGFRRGTIAMHAADWKPTAAAASSPGRAD